MKTRNYLIVALMATGCHHSSPVKIPAGEKSSRTDETNTIEAFKRCREMLKPGRANTAFIDREVYDKCFTDAMVGVEPRGQTPAPTPVDMDGDGIPDAVRYTSGMQIPYGLYIVRPDLYWPSIYQHYGYGVPAAPYAPVPSGYNSLMGKPGVVVGYPGDVVMAGTPSDIVRREEYEADRDALFGEVDANATDIADLQHQRAETPRK